LKDYIEERAIGQCYGAADGEGFQYGACGSNNIECLKNTLKKWFIFITVQETLAVHYTVRNSI